MSDTSFILTPLPVAFAFYPERAFTVSELIDIKIVYFKMNEDGGKNTIYITSAENKFEEVLVESVSGYIKKNRDSPLKNILSMVEGDEFWDITREIELIAEMISRKSQHYYNFIERSTFLNFISQKEEQNLI